MEFLLRELIRPIVSQPLPRFLLMELIVVMWMMNFLEEKDKKEKEEENKSILILVRMVPLMGMMLVWLLRRRSLRCKLPLMNSYWKMLEKLIT
jgi:hypothetical protein